MADIEVIDRADAAALAPFDAIIDVRSPAEFAEDHVPGAINLPVLDDAERARVGTIYVQESRFLARRVGAALVARNVAHHLETALADKPGGFRPLIYCWRGGQRSGAMATILAQVGWRTAVIAGGYRTYRRHVQARLYDEAPTLRLVLLDGRTGSGKTELLARLAARGMQTLDLEALAEHRGSVFGAVGRPQPSQKMFESRLLAALDALDPARPTVVEAEASKVGDRMVPPTLWKAMTAAPRLMVSAPLAARADYLAAHYAQVVADRVAFEAALARLPIHIGKQILEAWRALADAGDLASLAAGLIETHYDPAYDRASRKEGRPAPTGTVAMAGLADSDLEAAAAEIERLVALSPG
ncbi:MAG TPA: tRNA 2-selenouridine(34) synthase MnmH [Caulobacteraceae bacterium]|jgi:tRNA 2-selenouridine synthase|nr:tRNA 2-selenouridine(34) synthase MnmH [Caulobacteraceae bacterium]